MRFLPRINTLSLLYKAKVKLFTKKTTKLVDYFCVNTQVTGT